MDSALRFSVLASGSSGNAIYVEADNTRILIDAGLSGREVERRLETVGGNASTLNGLIITHEHSDHTKGAGPLARRYDIPVYLNRRTLETSTRILGKLPFPMIIETGRSLTIENLKVETFTKCHDAVDPIGLVISYNGISLGVVTDLGKSTRLIENRLKGCQALIIESNHDSMMLEQGPYPLHLKQRIKSRDGHLSNEQAANLLEVVCHSNLRQVVLSHLSEANNHPDKAYAQAAYVFKKMGLGSTEISVSRQDEPGPMIEVSDA